MKHISFRLVFTALCAALVLAFVLVITGVFFRNIRQFETGRAAAVDEESFEFAKDRLTKGLADLEATASLTVNDRDLLSLLTKDPASYTYRDRVAIQERISALLYKGKIIRRQISAVAVLTPGGTFSAGNLAFTSVNRENLLSYFGMEEQGGFHYYGKADQNIYYDSLALRRLEKYVFYIMPFTVLEENDSLVCVVGANYFWDSLFLESLRITVLAPDGTPILQYSSSDPVPEETSHLSYQTADGLRLLYETDRSFLTQDMNQFAKRALIALTLLLLGTAAVSWVLSIRITRPIRRFSEVLASYQSADDLPQNSPRNSLDMRELVSLFLSGIVLVACLIHTIYLGAAFPGLSESAFQIACQNRMKQITWETENYFINQRYATVSLTNDDTLLKELSKIDNIGEEELEESRETLRTILENACPLFPSPTDLTLFDATGLPIASTENARYVTSSLQTPPSAGETLWEVRQLSGVWYICTITRVYDPSSFLTLGYLQSQTDVRYPADSFPAQGDIAEACLLRQDGLILSSSGRFSAGEILSDEEGSRRMSSPVSGTSLHLSVLFSSDSLLTAQREFQNKAQWLLLTVIILATVFALILSHFVSAYLYRLLRKMANLPAKVSGFPVQESAMLSEFNLLNQSFGSLMERLDHLLTESVEAERKEKELLRINEEARFALLQSQINPHFLYNSFEMIASMIRCGEKDHAISALVSLSDMLRYAVSPAQIIVPLSEEIRYAKKYAEIMALRYEGSLTTEFTEDPDTADLSIVKFTIQPLLENAVQHGIRPRGGHGHISIRTECNDGMLCVYVTDDGLGIDPERLAELRQSLEDESASEQNQKHIGLKNIHQRIRGRYGEPYGIVIDSRKGRGTSVILSFPILKDGNN